MYIDWCDMVVIFKVAYPIVTKKAKDHESYIHESVTMRGSMSCHRRYKYSVIYDDFPFPLILSSPYPTPSNFRLIASLGSTSKGY